MDFNIRITTTSPKQSSNFLSKLCFTWLITLFHKGTKQTLKLLDLYDNFPADKSDMLGDKLEKFWKMELVVAKEKSTKPSLFRAIRKAFFWKYMAYGIVLLIEYAIVRPAQPMVLAIFIKSFSQTPTDDKLPTEMYWSAAAIIVLTIVVLFFHHHTNLIFGQLGMRVRIACCSLMYRKMMKLSKKSLAHATSGHVVNMMSNDVSRFDLIAPSLHHLWIMPIQAVIATYLIWLQVEVASVIGVGSLILLTLPVNTLAGKISAVLRSRIAQRTDRRVKKMSEIIAGIQVIKMYAWEKPFAKIIQNERISEINVLTLQSYLRGVIVSSCVFIERTALFLTVIAYVLLGNIVTADIVFSLAQFFNILQLSMAIHYPTATTTGSETLVSIKRLQDFLMLEEKATSVVEKNSSKGILFKNVTATWTTDTKLLSNVNIDIQQGTLCAVIGPVGMGKSSLLQLLLGELIPKSGQISVGGEISYASQEPWLFASSVQKNILFGLSYNQTRYREIVKVCALEKDFEQFPYGDKMEVGDRGVSLSGGQKARINLARAVYRPADIYLLDDPLSAVDTHVGKHLFQKCILEYLGDKTRILVTHQLQYLKSADHIVVINDGKIEAQGTFEELSKGDFDFTKMLASAEEGDEMRQLKRRESSTSVLSTTTQESEDIEGENIVGNEESISYHGSSAYYEYFKAGGNFCVLIGLALFFVLGQVFSNLTDLWLTFWTMQEKEYYSKCSDIEVIDATLLNSTATESSNAILDTEINSINNATNEDAIYCASIIDSYTAIYIYTALIILGILTLTFRSIYFFKVAMTASKNLHNNMFYTLLHAPMKFFDTNPSGRILNRFSRDMGMIDELLPRLMIQGLQIFLVMIGILVMVCITNVYIIAVAVVVGVLFYKLRGWYVTNARTIKHLEGIARSPVFSHMTATLNGITTIRSRSIEEVLAKEFDLHQDTHTAVWYLTLACTSSFGLWMDIISVIFIACVIAGFILIFVYGGIDGSLVGLAISQSMILTGMVQFGIKQVADVVSQMTGVERVLEYSKLEKEGAEGSKKCVTPPKNWPSEGNIKFVKLSLRYSITEPYVLNNLNFTVNAGEKVGIVGRTGAGKSSLIAALFRLAPLDGSILIDNIDTNTINLFDLRKKIAIIPQEPVLFSASLRYNLDPFKEFNDKDLWSALEEVELRDVATSLDFMVDEGGTNFSVGQRQLLCLARAILRQNNILILDEATANVDPKTDALIQKTIRHKFSKCTVLTVAHRLNTIMDSDKVLVMDAGRMVEYNHPYPLLQNKDGYLFKMVAETGSSMTKQLHEVAKSMYMKNIAEEQENEDTQL